MSFARRTFGVVAVLTIGTAALFLIGFVLFAQHVAAYQAPRDARAEGIVVLTGGASRIADAVELLQQGRARRLLITGVHPRATPAQIADKQDAEADRLYRCCIDLDRRALNTAGNAEETKRWVEEKGYRSIIVVTSEYHMPRSLTELARVLPAVELIPYPVSSPLLRENEHWSDGDIARLLLSEYVKYMVSLARQTIEQPNPRVSVAQARG